MRGEARRWPSLQVGGLVVVAFQRYLAAAARLEHTLDRARRVAAQVKLGTEGKPIRQVGYKSEPYAPM